VTESEPPALSAAESTTESTTEVEPDRPPTATAAVADGDPRRERRGSVTSYGTGRRCEIPGCTTVLSRYNDAARCWSHANDGPRT
jgi:hypothetical protein